MCKTKALYWLLILLLFLPSKIAAELSAITPKISLNGQIVSLDLINRWILVTSSQGKEINRIDLTLHQAQALAENWPNGLENHNLDFVSNNSLKSDLLGKKIKNQSLQFKLGQHYYTDQNTNDIQITNKNISDFRIINAEDSLQIENTQINPRARAVLFSKKVILKNNFFAKLGSTVIIRSR
jgi:hypothetical protein